MRKKRIRLIVSLAVIVLTSLLPPMRESSWSFAAHHSSSGEQGLAKLPLGVPVNGWFPFETEGSGIWKLAVSIGGTPTRVGVVDPAEGRWLDGPRELPVSGAPWSVRGREVDGSLEYIYAAGRALHSFDTRTSADSTLWNVPFDPARVLLWGADSSGNPLVGLLQSLNTSSGSQITSGSVWRVYDLRSPTPVLSIPGGAGSPVFLAGSPEIPGPLVALYQCYGQQYSGGGGTSRGHFEQRIRLVNLHWSTISTCELPQYDYFGGDLPRAPWGLAAFGYVGGRGSERGAIVWGVTSMGGFGVVLPDYIGAFAIGGGPRWSKNLPSPSSSPSPYSAFPYSSMAAWDRDDDGTEEIALPLWGGRGWEVRRLQDGIVIDTIRGYPQVELSNGPLFSAGKRELFFFKDSALNVFGPSRWGGIGDNSSGSGLSNLLIGSSNPFSGSVRLSIAPDQGPTTLSIFNILGQCVRKYDLQATDGTSVEWNGTNEQGRQVSSGVYFARLTGHHSPVVKKLILLK